MPLGLFFDSETNGLPLTYKGPQADLRNSKNWPRLLQLGFILADLETGEILLESDQFVDPLGTFELDLEAQKTHKITLETLQSKGKDLVDVIAYFLAEGVDKADVLIGHNISYDLNIVGAECYRLHLVEDIKTMGAKPRVCTMKSTTNLCRIPGPFGFKWPKLEELHVHLFGKGFEGAHDAMNDIRATKDCFMHLSSQGLIRIPELA